MKLSNTFFTLSLIAAFATFSTGASAQNYASEGRKFTVTISGDCGSCKEVLKEIRQECNLNIEDVGTEKEVKLTCGDTASEAKGRIAALLAKAACRTCTIDVNAE